MLQFSSYFITICKLITKVAQLLFKNFLISSVGVRTSIYSIVVVKSYSQASQTRILKAPPCVFGLVAGINIKLYSCINL